MDAALFGTVGGQRALASLSSIPSELAEVTRELHGIREGLEALVESLDRSIKEIKEELE